MQKSPLTPIRDGEMQDGMRSVAMCVHIMLLSERSFLFHCRDIPYYAIVGYYAFTLT